MSAATIIYKEVTRVKKNKEETNPIKIYNNESEEHIS